MPKHFPTDPVASDLIDVGYFDDAYKGAEEYVNYGIENEDLKGHAFASGQMQPNSNSSSELNWVETKHIYKPDFYGSPSPRMEGVSALVYHRQTDHSIEKRSIHHAAATAGEWVWVPGITATIKIPPPYTRTAFKTKSEVKLDKNDHAVTVLCTFYAFEMGGSGAEFGGFVEDVWKPYSGHAVGVDYQDGNYEFGKVADFALFVNDDRRSSTDRTLYESTRWNWMGARKQFSIMQTLHLPVGVHNIGVKIKVANVEHDLQPRQTIPSYRTGRTFGGANKSVTPDFTAASFKHIFVGGRNLVIHVDRR